MNKQECLNFLEKSPVGNILDFSRWDDPDEELDYYELIGLNTKKLKKFPYLLKESKD